MMYHSILILTGMVTKAASVVDAQDPQDITRFPYLHYSFSCVDKAIGYYADPAFGCQIFHMCDAFGRRIPHICPPLTLFNQKFRVCDWAYNVQCEEAIDHYYLNELTYEEPVFEDTGERPRSDEDPLTTSRGNLLSIGKIRKISRIRRRRLNAEEWPEKEKQSSVMPASKDTKDRSTEDALIDKDALQVRQDDKGIYDQETKGRTPDKEKNISFSTEWLELKDKHVT
ncbi:uncharacterized protein LOC111262846 isoform X2 [Varroa jacobsoni]|uniref:uncharacterized protein LOC111262846 isoform X2 n=1 Tax=Varroa jacobsoni TaxID=62625 RepID=UPI000BF9443E|nr:uncharacterized protein LOC111262846 isoform X2 [Varroa jacobsoni]